LPAHGQRFLHLHSCDWLGSPVIQKDFSSMAHETPRVKQDDTLKGLISRLAKLQQSRTAHAAQFRGDILVRAIEEQIKDVRQKIADLTGADERRRPSAGSSSMPKPRRTAPTAGDEADLGSSPTRPMHYLGHH
jgi:hypothetical protein